MSIQAINVRNQFKGKVREIIRGDVVSEVHEFFSERLERLLENGVELERTILDPGIGFGKNCEHNLELLARMGHFRSRAALRPKRPTS